MDLNFVIIVILFGVVILVLFDVAINNIMSTDDSSKDDDNEYMRQIRIKYSEGAIEERAKQRDIAFKEFRNHLKETPKNEEEFNSYMKRQNDIIDRMCQ